MIRGLPSLARLWSRSWAIPRTAELIVSTFASFRHARISTVEKIYTKMQMQDLIDDF
jgi:hypothetical protein